MLTGDFIRNHCTSTGILRAGIVGNHEVFITSPAAIMSAMPSCDSEEDPEMVGLEQSWHSVFESKRADNRCDAEAGIGPLAFLAKEGFCTPLCILTFNASLYRFHNGNHRLAAAIDLGFTEVPVVFIDKWDDHYDERWEVTEVRELEYPVLIPPPAKPAVA